MSIYLDMTNETSDVPLVLLITSENKIYLFIPGIGNLEISYSRRIRGNLV